MNKALVTGLLLLSLAGCGGSSTDAGAPATPADSAVAASRPAAAVKTDDPCQVLTVEELNAALGTEFEAGESSTDDARQITECKYTMTEDAGGVQVPTKIVDVVLTQVPGSEAYKTNLDLAPAYFGGDPQTLDVPGADKAYVVINEATQSPVVGILVGDQFAMVQIGVEGATVEQATQLAQTAATRLG